MSFLERIEKEDVNDSLLRACFYTMRGIAADLGFYGFTDIDKEFERRMSAKEKEKVS